MTIGFLTKAKLTMRVIDFTQDKNGRILEILVNYALIYSLNSIFWGTIL